MVLVWASREHVGCIQNISNFDCLLLIMYSKDFFDTVVLPGLSQDNYYNSQFGYVWQIHTSELPVWNEENKPHLAIIGVEEERPSVGNADTAKGPDAVRRHLYQLYQGDYPVKVVD